MSGGVCAGMAFCAVVFDFFEALYGFFVYGAAGSLPGGGKRGFAEAQKEQKAGNGGRTKKKNNERCRKSSAENPFRGSNGQTVQRAVCAPPTAWRERRRNGKCDETRLKVAPQNLGKNSAKLFGNAFGAGPCAFLLICERAACCRAEDICLRFFCIKYSIRLKGFRKAVQISVCRMSGRPLGGDFCVLSPAFFTLSFVLTALLIFAWVSASGRGF